MSPIPDLLEFVDTVHVLKGVHCSDPPAGLSIVDLRCFTQDRFRAVRQELEQQYIRSRLAVRMLEDMVRYSIMTVHEMCQGMLKHKLCLRMQVSFVYFCVCRF